MKGEISKETYEEWNRETGTEKLPERVGSKGAAKKKTKSKPTKRKTTTRAKGKVRKR